MTKDVGCVDVSQDWILGRSVQEFFMREAAQNSGRRDYAAGGRQMPRPGQYSQGLIGKQTKQTETKRSKLQRDVEMEKKLAETLPLRFIFILRSGRLKRGQSQLLCPLSRIRSLDLSIPIECKARRNEPWRLQSYLQDEPRWGW